MQIIENTKVKEKLYIEKLENGLTVMIIPKKGMKKKYAIWGTRYGSVNNKFIVPGETEITTVPDGVAHFLEHKMFEQSNGKNSLDVLSSLGVNANAYTTNDHTAYLFECTDNFDSAFAELADYIQHPYFTEENVEKEKGIIGQEISMYDDEPSWQVYMNAMRAMYHKNPVRIDIAGTQETISEIDKDILYKCYQTFYHPSNMALVLCGDFNPEEMMEEVKNKQILQQAHGKIKKIYEDEPTEIKEKGIKVQMEVSIPDIIIAYKDSVKSDKIVEKHIAIELLLNLIFGKSSNLYKKLYEEGIVLQELEYTYEFTESYAHVIIGAQSQEPDKLKEYINNEIEKIKQEGIDEEHFNRMKRMLYGEYIKEYNDVANIARMFLADYFKGINSFDYLEMIETITKEYAEQILKDIFVEKNQVVSIVEPKNV